MLFSCVVFAPSNFAYAADSDTDSVSDDGINIAKITQYSLLALQKNPFGNYLNYRQLGMCYWLVCAGVYCTVQTSAYVRHFLPDLLVSVFPEYGKNPFTLANETIDKPLHTTGQAIAKSYFGSESGGGTAGATKRGLMDRFYEVDVIGNPAINLIDSSIYLSHINSVATPMMPYFSSLLDVITWRTPMLENAAYPMYSLPFVRELGERYNSWGNIFPRSGFVVQGTQYKAGAVIAVRGANIATKNPVPHLVTPIQTGSCGWADCQIYGIKENDPKNVKWQRIYPEPVTDVSQDDFGKSDLTDLEPYGSEYGKKGNNRYAFLAWRRYQGCVYHTGTYLYAIKYAGEAGEE